MHRGDHVRSGGEAGVAHAPGGDLLVEHATVEGVVVDDQGAQTGELADGRGGGNLWTEQQRRR